MNKLLKRFFNFAGLGLGLCLVSQVSLGAESIVRAPWLHFPDVGKVIAVSYHTFSDQTSNPQPPYDSQSQFGQSNTDQVTTAGGGSDAVYFGVDACTFRYPGTARSAEAVSHMDFSSLNDPEAHCTTLIPPWFRQDDDRIKSFFSLALERNLKERLGSVHDHSRRRVVAGVVGSALGALVGLTVTSAVLSRLDWGERELTLNLDPIAEFRTFRPGRLIQIAVVVGSGVAGYYFGKQWLGKAYDRANYQLNRKNIPRYFVPDSTFSEEGIYLPVDLSVDKVVTSDQIFRAFKKALKEAGESTYSFAHRGSDGGGGTDLSPEH